MICTLPPPPEREQTTGASRLALQLSRKWAGRLALRVRFLEGDPRLQRYVADAVTGPRGWNACSGMQFRFTDEPDAEVRIMFQPGASWSQLGTDALWLPPHMATMNLAIRIQDAGEHIDRPIHHEFGHALGFPHGQQAPDVGDLNIEAVYRFYEERTNWTRAQIDAQVIDRLPRDDVMAIGRKGPSVMNYDMPAELWQDGLPMLTSAYPTYWDAYAASMFYGDPPGNYTSVILPFVARS